MFITSFSAPRKKSKCSSVHHGVDVFMLEDLREGVSRKFPHIVCPGQYEDWVRTVILPKHARGELCISCNEKSVFLHGNQAPSHVKSSLCPYAHEGRTLAWTSPRKYLPMSAGVTAFSRGAAGPGTWVDFLRSVEIFPHQLGA